MPASWRHVKEELLFAPLTPAEAVGIEETGCGICQDTFRELENAGRGLFRLRHCQCNYWYCRECIDKFWDSKRDGKNSGPGDQGPCPICKAEGIPADDIFPFHADYVGDLAIKEIVSDYFGARTGASRFSWESLVIQVVKVGAPNLPYATAMRTSLQQRLGQEFTYDELLRDLRGTGKSVAPARTRMGDIDKEARKLIDEQLRDYRFGSIKSHDSFARELNQSFKYVGCRIEERRNKPSKKRKRSKEPDGDRVEAILGHEVNPEGKIIYEVKWLGWEGSTFEARKNIHSKKVKHCPELLWVYHQTLHEDDEIFDRGGIKRPWLDEEIPYEQIDVPLGQEQDGEEELIGAIDILV
ncbi:hypothetical protein LTS10_012024 [Elasticomyces elasticus]|nr:hypothetical protein LTS10_012024 [Elasticomyces elasticus]